jgi:hypothetical protein
MTDDGGTTPAARAAPAPGSGWQVSVGSARGAAHQAADLPNQDAAAYRDPGGPGGAVIVAIADGHGHSRHFRSGSGSALAVDTACRVAAALAAGLAARDGHAALSRADVDTAARAQLVPALVRDWRAAVAAHLAEQPFTALEQARLDADGDEPEIPYGATLLVVTVLARWLICAQIGDGDMLAIQPDGRSFSPVPTLEKLGGERTRSLCQPDAQNSFRVAVLDLAAQPLVAVLLATDGYGNSQTADPWQPGVGRDLATFAGEHDHGWFEHQVPGWAQRCASADGSGDDTTIALLVRPDAAVAGEVPPPTVPVPAGILPPEGTSTETLELGRAGPSTETMELDRADPPTDTLELDRAPAVELGRVPAASPARPRFQVSGPARARGSGTRGSGPGGLPPVAGITSSRRTAVLIAGAIALAVLAAVIVVLFALRSSPAPGPARHVQPASHPSAAAGPRSEASATASTGTNRTDGTSDPGRARGAGPDRRQAKASGPAGTQHEGDS